MATPKQVREHYGRIDRHFNRLNQALHDAHNEGVLEYETFDQGPFDNMVKLWNIILKTTEKQLAQAMRTEIRNGKKGPD